MKKEQKAEVIDEIAAQIQQAGAVYAVDYRGLSVTQAAALRTSLREAGASFRVVKNTLTLRAADKAGAEPLKPLVEEGPTALTFVQGDAALAAKALDSFVRQAQVMQLKGGVLEGRPLGVDEIRTLARLPSRDQLNAQIAGVIASPITGLVRGLGSLLSGLAIALGQVQGKKEAEAPEPKAQAPEPEEADAAEAEAPEPEGDAPEAAGSDSEQPDSEADEADKEAE